MSSTTISLDDVTDAFQKGGAALIDWLLDFLLGLAAATTTPDDNAQQQKQQQIMTKIAVSALLEEANCDALVHVLWIFGASTTSSAAADSDTDQRDDIVVRLLQTLKTEASVSETDATMRRLHDKLVAHFQASVLQTSGWIAGGASHLEKKLKLYNTQTHYKQIKYNLLAEQTEGYSKYLVLLYNNMGQQETSATTRTVDAIATAIGTFKLDPVRCTDLLIDVLVLKDTMRNSTAAAHSTSTDSAHDATLIQILKQFFQPMLGHLPDLLLFKLSGMAEAPDRRTSLFRVMVKLVQHQLLNAKRMIQVLLAAALQQGQTHFSVMYDTVYQRLEQSLRGMGRIKLTSSASTANGDSAAADKEAEQQQEQQRLLDELAQSHAIQLILAFFQSGHGSLLLTSSSSANKSPSNVENGDKMANLGVMDEYEWSQLCFLLPDTLGVAICDHVQHEIQPYLPKAAKVQWSNSETRQSATDTGNDAMEVETETPPVVTMSLGDIVDKIYGPLMCIRESGCILLRPILYTQLCRLLAFELKAANEMNLPSSVIDLVKLFLLPSLSLFPANPTLAHEMWTVLKFLPYQTRYALYDAWRGRGLERAGLGDPTKPLWLMESEFKAGKDVRYALKRLSKDTIRDMSRHIAKVCHSHPLVVFTSILGQIESYDNLVQFMVDSLRYVTPLGLDVLSCSILNRLSKSNAADGANRNRLKEDGLNVSQWLQSLEAFVGYFYKQFPFVDFQGILSYLMTRLKDGHVMELGLLRALLKTAAGWSFADYSPAASLSHTQLLGRSGSHTLKKETMSFGIVEGITRKTSREIRRMLQVDDTGVCLLILLAQVRNYIVFGKSMADENFKPIKLVAYLLDTCQVTMTILLDFLSYAGSDDGGPASPIRRYAEALPTLKDLYTVYELDGATAWMFHRPLQQLGVNRDDNAMETLASSDGSEALRTLYSSMLPASAWQHLTIDLFEFFYSHSLYDIQCPEDIYKSEIVRLEKEAERLAQQKSGPGTAQTGSHAKEAASILSNDFALQQEHVSLVCRTIGSDSQFFKAGCVSHEAMSAFVSSCIYPRCMQSPDDALYCAHFVSLLNKHHVKGFGTLFLFESIITKLPRTLLNLTEGEAANLSILLLEVWKSASRWRYDEDAYETELVGINQLVWHDDSGVADSTYEDYKDIYNKWHATLGSVVIGALKSSEYIHIRNCLIVLTRLVTEFPTRPGLANTLMKSLEPLADEEITTFADIRAAATAYSRQLIRSRDDGVWREESAFAVEARQRRHEAAVAARQKKAEMQMEEIKLDSEKIGKELGPDRWRDDRRRGGRSDEPRDRDRRLAPIMEPPVRLNNHDNNQPGPVSRPEEGRNSHTLSDFSTMASDKSRNLGGRFQRPESDRGRTDGAGTKRSRTASPEEGESADRGDSKRARLDSADGGRPRNGSRRRGGRGRR